MHRRFEETDINKKIMQCRMLGASESTDISNVFQVFFAFCFNKETDKEVLLCETLKEICTAEGTFSAVIIRVKLYGKTM